MILYLNPYIFSNLPPSRQWMLVAMMALNTFIFPAFAILLMKQLKFISSLQMPDKKDRIAPYMACLVFYIWAYAVFRKTGLPSILSIVVLGACISLSVVFVINSFQKISIHAAGWGSAVALLFGLTIFSTYNIFPVVMLGILIAGIVGSGRLLLSAHKPSDVYLGYFIGFMSQMIAWKFL
jgi:membrane-associated phospholipid phosphatase